MQSAGHAGSLDTAGVATEPGVDGHAVPAAGPGTDFRAPVAEKPSAGGGYALPVYPFRTPPELSGGPRRKYPVVVVGAGLAGLTAACELARLGIDAVLLDEDDTIGVKGASSRGICYAQKSLEIFLKLGIYERIRDKGVQWSVGKTLAGDDIVYEFDLRTASTHSASCQPPFINIQQFYVEWFLADRVAELGHVDLRWQSRVVGVSQDDSAVKVQIETPAGRYELETDWLIDASGIHSKVRRAFDLQTNPADGVDQWCISDVRFKVTPPTERWTWIEARFNENRAVWQHLMGDDVWRLDYQMDPTADPTEISRPEVVADRLRQQFGDDVDYELIWVGPYSYRSHLLEKFRHGRVLFIGDAAHVMSPFGARGGNSGVQDADNLVWKLKLVLEGRVGAGLMDNFDEERHEGGRQNIEFTNRTMNFLSPRTAVSRTIRNAVIGLAREYPFARALVNTGRLSSPNIYHQSLLNVGRGGGASVPNVLVNDAGLDLATVVASGAELICLAADAAALATALEHAQACVLRVHCYALDFDAAGHRRLSSASLAERLTLAAGEVALIRPDLYLAGCGRPDVLFGALGERLGALSAPPELEPIEARS